ncbi:MAG: TrkA family potassium uptake protein [Alphaproteobacteria bacterium]|nr:TrkA family potassium uptake protein [Alphaproteobacteria bacterium]
MARQQAIVVGLGQFGMALARALAANDVDVVAVDRREARAQLAASFAAEAMTLDAMDEEELARLGPSRRDICVCAIGDDGREASIVVTALLRQMGAPRVVARATDELHERILHLVGAHEVVNPERIYGERLAARMSYRGILDSLPLGEDLVITELVVPRAFVGRSLNDLQLPRRFQVTVVAIRRDNDGKGGLVMPTASEVLVAGDVLVLVAPHGAAQALAERV